LEASYYNDKYNPHILAVFGGVSARLGLSDPSKLFEIHVSQIAYSILYAGLDFLRCPPEVLGYEHRKACAESALHAFAPIYILMGGDDPETIARGCRSFANHCQAAQISVADGYRDCFTVFVGFELVSNVEKISAESSSPVDWHFTHVDKSWLGETSIEDQMANDIDGIVIVVLRTLGDQECQKILAELGDKYQREGHVFRALTAYRTNGDLKTHDANLPSYDVGTVLRALGWLSKHIPDTDSASTTYHVIQQLLADIQESPLVNEQLRYMNALCLWVSFHFRHFRGPVLLHTLIHGITSLLEQIDLALATKSILEWAFSQYAQVTEKDHRLANVLIRLCCVANEHANTKNPVVSKIGEELLHWLEGQMLQLVRFPSVKNQVTKAFPAWPREPPPELESVCRDISAHALSSVLSDFRIASNKFTLVRRLCKMSFLGDYSQEQFSRMDIWRLKDCIPPPQQLQTADIHAFASLLLLNKGQIHSFGLNPLSSQLPKHQHARIPRGKASKSSPSDSSIVAERSILELLLTMLDSDTPSKVHMAYRVLRTLPIENLPDTESSVTEYGTTALSYFRGRSRRSPTRPPTLLRILLASDVYVNMAQDFEAWITTFATLLCDVLADHDFFYSRLPPILQTDSDFAEQVTPILVHILLSTSIGDSDIKTSETPRVILSQFLSRVLNLPTSNMSSLRAVVNIVLHLRNSQPPQPNEELAYNKWLDLDFMLLSKSAIVSGAYTTALLFHELALEYSAPDASSSSSDDPENILFEIYSHIEEPDGFYGIKTQDLHHFLLKRFHHEHQWEKAFKFHGAALEARRQGGVDTEGVLHSLYSFGFDTLALSVQQNVFDASDLGATSSNMVYHLGWRTETWDLPDQASSSGSGTALYNALRAVSRERNPQAVDTIVRKALMNETERFRLLGDEDLAGIREVARNVMCLSQVNSLRMDLQECQKSGMLDPALWSKFVEIDGNFEYVYLCLVQVISLNSHPAFPLWRTLWPPASRSSALRDIRNRDNKLGLR
jgi:ataxia telangiectasia mutated family protein